MINLKIAILGLLIFGSIYSTIAQDQFDRSSIKIGIMGSNANDVTYANNVNFSEDSLLLRGGFGNSNSIPILSLRFERAYGINAVWTTGIKFRTAKKVIAVYDDEFDPNQGFPFPPIPSINQDRIIEVENKETDIALTTGFLWQLVKKKKTNRFNINIGPSLDIHYYDNLDYFFDQATVELQSYEDKGLAIGLDVMTEFSLLVTSHISIGLRYSANLVQQNIELGDEKYPEIRGANPHISNQRTKDLFLHGAALELGYNF